KPRTAASKRVLKNREPKVIEDPKTVLCVRGATTSEVCLDVLKDVYALRRPNAILFSRKNDLHPFDDPRPIEFLAAKNDSPLMVFVNHSKKRPNNLIFIRLFDNQIMDLVEFGVERVLPMMAIEGKKPTVGHRPCLVFQGDKFEVDETYKSLKNLFMDFFGAHEVIEQIDLRGLDHVISITADVDGKIHFRSYIVTLLKSGSKMPKVELTDCGPSIEMELRRTRFGDEALYREAMRVPKELKPKKEKNIERDVMGDKIGRIHMEKQDISKLQTRKMKGLKRGREEDTNEEDGGETKSVPKKNKGPSVTAKKGRRERRQIPGLLMIATFGMMAFLLIDDKYETIISKKDNKVTVTKSKFGYIMWKRVGNLDELKQVEITEVEIKKKKSGWVLDLEFMSHFGIYRLRTADTLVLGDANVATLQEVKKKIDTYLQLKSNPFKRFGNGPPEKTK
ncbi:rRNA-binding ribosome biosynthesis protein rpf2, partial [Blyttiomyces sp. JEL0837]